MQTTGSITKTKWSIDRAHSYIGFRAKHLMFTNVRGSFNEFDATVYTSGDDFTNAEIDCRLNPASICTGDEKRDAHLKSNDFLDVENFKEIRFTGKSFVDMDKSGNYELLGDLSIRGVKQEIKLQAEFGGIIKDPWGNKKALFTVSGKINRKDWGLKWNVALETGGTLVGEDIWINCEVQLFADHPDEANAAD